MLAQEYDRKLLGLSTLHLKEQALGQVRVFRCRRPGPGPGRHTPAVPRAHLTELQLSDRLPLRHLDQPHLYQLLLLEPSTLAAWEALQKLEARLAASNPARVVVACLGSTGGAIALPIPLATAIPTYKGFKVFAAYYIPRLKLKRKIKLPPPVSTFPVAEPAIPALESIKEEMPKKKEEQSERASSVASRTPSVSTPKPDSLQTAPASSAGSSASKPRPHGEKEKRRKDNSSPKHKREKSKRER